MNTTTSRLAKCLCGDTRPSSRELAFFEDQSAGSRMATISCKICNYHDVAHDQPIPENARARRPFHGHEFVPRGEFEFDRFYCGCRGWD